MGGGYNLVKIKRLDESQHALGLTELAGHSLLPHLASPLQQAEAETCLRPGAELSCGSAGQSRISTLTVGCGAPGPGGTPGSGTDWNYFFLFSAAERTTLAVVWRDCPASSFHTDTTTDGRVSSTGETRLVFRLKYNRIT